MIKNPKPFLEFKLLFEKICFTLLLVFEGKYFLTIALLVLLERKSVTATPSDLKPLGFKRISLFQDGSDSTSSVGESKRTKLVFFEKVLLTGGIFKRGRFGLSINALNRNIRTVKDVLVKDVT